MSNPRLVHLARHWTDEELDAALYHPVEPLKLGRLTPECGAEQFEATARSLFVPTGQIRSIVRTILQVGLAWASRHYADTDHYRNGLYASDPWSGSSMPAICLTGLAGTGKTRLLMALGRLLDREPRSHSIPGIRNIPVTPLWPLSARDGFSAQALLSGVLGLLPEHPPNGDEPPATAAMKPRNLTDMARRRAWRDAVSLMTIDEFQFVSQGGDANARATKVLLMLCGIGPRLIYCANFSLLHKLRRRNHEDRQRLLTHPLVLEPDLPGSADWIAYLDALKAIDPESFGFDVLALQDLIHEYTFGIRRLAMLLLKTAFHLSHARSRSSSVDAEVIRRAYLSPDYQVNREDVELLISQAVEKRSLRDDLWCPFHDLNDQATSAAKDGAAKQPDKVVPLTAATDAFERRSEDALLRAALNTKEAATYKELDPEKAGTADTAQVVRFPKPKPTRENLQSGALALEAFAKKPSTASSHRSKEPRTTAKEDKTS